MRIVRFLFVALAATFILTGCSKYDDTQVKQDITNLDDRVTKLENEVSSLKSALFNFQLLVEGKYTIDSFVKTEEGWKLSFTNGESMLLRDGEKGATGQPGESYIRSIAQDGGVLTIVLNDQAQSTFRIPCQMFMSIGDEKSPTVGLVTGINEIPLVISDIQRVASVTAAMFAGSSIITDTKTRSTAPTDWNVQVANDFSKVVVEVPANTTITSALLQLGVLLDDGASYTVSKALSSPVVWTTALSLGKTEATSLALETGVDISGYSSDATHKPLNTAKTLWEYLDNEKVLHIQTSGHAVMAPQDASRLFWDYTHVVSISGLDKLDVSGVDNMSEMFLDCNRLKELDVTGFNTTNVTNMSKMFYGCYSLMKLDVSKFDTQKVTDMSGMFGNCSSLEAMDLSGFKTPALTNTSFMFDMCEDIEKITFSADFNTSSVTTMEAMFKDCASLGNMDLTHFNTSQVTNFADMFSWCVAMTEIDLSSFSTPTVDINMYCMFDCCENATSIKLGAGFTNIPTDPEKIKGMFFGTGHRLPAGTNCIVTGPASISSRVSDEESCWGKQDQKAPYGGYVRSSNVQFQNL